ncbi:hypothetical protein YC2023_042847 [Brassica napus]
MEFGIYKVENKEYGVVRKRRLTAHYREIFGEPGSRLDPASSSAPSSSGQETVPGGGLTDVLHRT